MSLERTCRQTRCRIKFYWNLKNKVCGTIVGTIVFLVRYSVIFYVYRNEAKCLDKL
jgi:hypothetical protein